MANCEVDVIIVGAGIAGSALATALTRVGVEVLVLEEAMELQPLGAGIALMPPALSMAERLGLLSSFHESSVVLPVLRRCSADGTVLLEIEYSSVWAGREVRAIKRTTLAEILVSGVPSDRVRLGQQVVEVRNEGSMAEVLLASGDTLRARLVVGADGVHSAVRRSVSPETQVSASGQRYLRSFLPGEPLVDTYTAWVGRGLSFGLVPLREGTHIFGLEITKETEFRPMAGRADRARTMCRSFTAAPAQIALERLIDEEVHEGPGWEVDLAPSLWRRGRVVMLGDAVHAMPPPMGLGGALAMEDAWVLADEFHKDDVDGTLDRWIHRRGPRVRHIQLATAHWLESAAAGRLDDPAAALRAAYEPMFTLP